MIIEVELRGQKKVKVGSVSVTQEAEQGEQREGESRRKIPYLPYCSPPQSLLDLLRARKRYTEPESRFYLTQLVGACDYMHANSVIHRDLKLGNLMLDENMDLRVGDFGLAALVKFPGERKKYVAFPAYSPRRG